ncbi:MAG: leucine-rich repeat protein, partial [Mycoplasma sp.]
SGFTGDLDLSKLTQLISIGNNAFYGCSGFTGDLDLSKLTSIGRYAFYDCKLNSIIVSNTLFENHNTKWSQGYWNNKSGDESNVINKGV